MKKIVTTLGLMVLTGTLFFACAPAFEPPGAEKYDLRSAYAKDRYTYISTTSIGTKPLQPNTGGSAGIQVFTITTETWQVSNNGTLQQAPAGKKLNLDIGENGRIPGLSIKAAASFANYARYTLSDDEIDYKARKSAEDSVEISMPLTETWIVSDKFVVIIDSEAATFNGENILNQDKDNLVAEGEEDTFAITGTFSNSSPGRITKWQATDAYWAIAWASRSTELLALDTSSSTIPATTIKSGQAYLAGNITDTGSENGNLIDTEALKTAFQAQKLSADGTWGPFTVTSTYHSKDEIIDGDSWNKGDVEVKFDDLSDYDQIRYRIDNYYIKESTAVGGFVHRGSYNNGIKDRPNDTIPADDSSWNYVVVGTISKEGITGGIELPVVTVNSVTCGGISGAYYADVLLAVSSPYHAEYWKHDSYTGTTRDAPELPAVDGDNYRNNLKIFHRKGNKVQDLLDLSGFRFEKRGPLTFRIYVPKNFKVFDTANSGFDIYVLPGLAPSVPVTGGAIQYLKPTGDNIFGGASGSDDYN